MKYITQLSTLCILLGIICCSCMVEKGTEENLEDSKLSKSVFQLRFVPGNSLTILLAFSFIFANRPVRDLGSANAEPR